MSGEQRKAAREDEESKFEAHVYRALLTEEGRAIFKFLFNRCGYSKKSLALGRTGEVLNDDTLYNEARRGVYIELRGFAPLEALMKVELAAEEEHRAPVGAANKKKNKEERK